MAKKESNKKLKNSKNKKSFFKDFKAEIKKVVWPTPKQLVNNTSAVVVIVLVTAAIVFCLDFVFKSANNFVVDKAESLIESVNESNGENTTSEDSEGEEATDTTDSEDAVVDEGTEDTSEEDTTVDESENATAGESAE
ncbi:MAG: preprotein translocase subunit SecE [Clostridia bacterium]|nr:preprotein translocase subunit SecE [Clostridia bacterium]